jgi:hypothetical protein
MAHNVHYCTNELWKTHYHYALELYSSIEQVVENKDTIMENAVDTRYRF